MVVARMTPRSATLAAFTGRAGQTVADLVEGNL
jgi:hypothetical protein